MTFKKYKEEVLEDPRAIKLNFEPDGRNHYVYRVSNKYIVYHYYGSKSEKLNVTVDTIGVSYFTSSNDNIFERGFREYYNDWEVKIVKRFSNSADKILFESYLHQKFDVKCHNGFINRSNQTAFGFDTTGVKKTEGTLEKIRKPVYQYDLDGNYIREFDSQLTAIKIIGLVSSAGISACCSGILPTAGGFIWQDFKVKKIAPYNKKKILIPVYQYDLDGNYIREFDSRTQASIVVGINSNTSIGACCQGAQETAGGFRWSDNKLDFINYTKSPRLKPVYQYDLDGNYIREFDSRTQASEEIGLNIGANIGACCRGIQPTAGGFRWYEKQLKQLRKK